MAENKKIYELDTISSLTLNDDARLLVCQDSLTRQVKLSEFKKEFNGDNQMPSDIRFYSTKAMNEKIKTINNHISDVENSIVNTVKTQIDSLSDNLGLDIENEHNYWVTVTEEMDGRIKTNTRDLHNLTSNLYGGTLITIDKTTGDEKEYTTINGDLELTICGNTKGRTQTGADREWFEDPVTTIDLSDEADGENYKYMYYPTEENLSDYADVYKAPCKSDIKLTHDFATFYPLDTSVAISQYGYKDHDTGEIKRKFTEIAKLNLLAGRRLYNLDQTNPEIGGSDFTKSMEEKASEIMSSPTNSAQSCYYMPFATEYFDDDGDLRKKFTPITSIKDYTFSDNVNKEGISENHKADKLYSYYEKEYDYYYGDGTAPSKEKINKFSGLTELNLLVGKRIYELEQEIQKTQVSLQQNIDSSVAEISKDSKKTVFKNQNDDDGLLLDGAIEKIIHGNLNMSKSIERNASYMRVYWKLEKTADGAMKAINLKDMINDVYIGDIYDEIVNLKSGEWYTCEKKISFNGVISPLSDALKITDGNTTSTTSGIYQLDIKFKGFRKRIITGDAGIAVYVDVKAIPIDLFIGGAGDTNRTYTDYSMLNENNSAITEGGKPYATLTITQIDFY